MKHSLVVVTTEQYKFLLPAHKADHFFKGNRIIIKKALYCAINPLPIFRDYLTSRDECFPLYSPLWVLHSGAVPTHQFFIACFHHFFDCNVAGQSMRAGGATSLAEHGVAPPIHGQMDFQRFSHLHSKKSGPHSGLTLYEPLRLIFPSFWTIDYWPHLSPFVFFLFLLLQKKQHFLINSSLSLASSHHSSSPKKKILSIAVPTWYNKNL